MMCDFATGDLTITHFFSRRATWLPLAAMALVGNAGSSASSPATEPQLVVMAPVVVPIVGSDRLEGALHLKLVLAAPDATALARLTQRLPALRAVTIAHAIEFSRLYASTQTPVNAFKLRSTLTTALRAKDKDVRDVLIVEVAAVA